MASAASATRKRRKSKQQYVKSERAEINTVTELCAVWLCRGQNSGSSGSITIITYLSSCVIALSFTFCQRKTQNVNQRTTTINSTLQSREQKKYCVFAFFLSCYVGMGLGLDWVQWSGSLRRVNGLWFLGSDWY